MTKGLATTTLPTPVNTGRCERIRTFDPLHPMQVRYQAAPHTEAREYTVANRVSKSRQQQLPDFHELATDLIPIRRIGLPASPRRG